MATCWNRIDPSRTSYNLFFHPDRTRKRQITWNRPKETSITWQNLEDPWRILLLYWNVLTLLKASWNLPSIFENVREPCRTSKNIKPCEPWRSSSALSDPYRTLDESWRTSACLGKPQRRSANLGEPKRTFANLIEPQRTSANLCEPSWNSENIWELLRTFDNPREPLRTSQNLCEPLKTSDKLWEHLRTYENHWEPLETNTENFWKKNF